MRVCCKEKKKGNILLCIKNLWKILSGFISILEVRIYVFEFVITDRRRPDEEKHYLSRSHLTQGKISSLLELKRTLSLYLLLGYIFENKNLLPPCNHQSQKCIHTSETM
jgi:hypothetical protein